MTCSHQEQFKADQTLISISFFEDIISVSSELPVTH